MKTTILGAVLAVLVWGLGTAEAARPHTIIRAKQGANLEQIVKDLPSDGTASIFVEAGDYVAHNLWKPGVNIYGEPGAHLFWTNATDGVGILDDRVPGAGTNTFVWEGTITFHNDAEADTAVNGPFVITNANTIAHIRVGRVEYQCLDNRTFPAGAFVVLNCREVFIDCDTITDDLNGLADSYASGLYWRLGTTHLRFGRMVMDNGYGIWAEEGVNTNATPADLYVKGDYLSVDLGVGFPTCVRFTATNEGYRAWLDIEDIRNFATDSYAVGMDGGGGRLYLKGGKLGSATSAVQILAGTGWFQFDKVSASLGNWLTASGGRTLWSVRHWEDATTNLSAGWFLTGGRHYLGPGVAEILNGRGLIHLGGTNRVQGMVIDTIGTNVTASVTNNRPVTIGAGVSNLVLNSVTLLSPIATAGGGAYSIFTTSGVSHVTMSGTVTLNSNYNTTVVPINAALLTTNLTQLR